MKKIYFVVGTDTGVGKTVATSLMTRYLRDQGANAMAVKPFCSAGRDDARWIREALGKTATLNEINPWHFRAALTPLLAARKQGVRVEIEECLEFIENARRGCDTLLIEGAGGLLSPLGEGFDARDLIAKTKATPLIVCPNRLGAINQVRLVLAALPKGVADRALVILVEPETRNSIATTNRVLLRELVDESRVVSFPRVRWPDVLSERRFSPQIVAAIRSMQITD